MRKDHKLPPSKKTWEGIRFKRNDNIIHQEGLKFYSEDVND